MMSEVGIPMTLHTATATWAARHSVSVETVLCEALRTYMEDVGLGLLPAPDPDPGWLGRVQARHGPRYGRGT